ncbi:MAG: hypothetical protein V4569_13045 [Pseudomonadota bacterium]
MELRLHLHRWERREPDWLAAAASGFAAGAVLMVLELVWAAVMSTAGPWRISQLIAAIVLGTETLQPSAAGAFSVSVVAVALVIHYAAGTAFGMAAAFIGAGFHYDTSPAMMAAMGAAFGAELYVFSFHIATLVFPWLVELRGWPTLAAHLIFGVTGALMYWKLARRPAESQRNP